MNIEKRIELIKRNTAEIITENELINLLRKKEKPIVYCGYEPSGDMHLGHFVTILKLMDFEKAGFKVKILLADVHALLNKKGDEKQIKKEVESWKKTLKSIGLKAEIVLGSDFEFEKQYQVDVMNLAQNSTINRGLRSMQEIARDIENATISQLWYPLMQIVDIKYLKVNVALGGLEQRKVHMMGKEMTNIISHNFVAIHTPLIISLKGPGNKMSKSIPGSGISINDSYENIKKYIKEAYCPEKEINDNPIMQICKLIIFPKREFLEIKRFDKFGGNLIIKHYEDLERLYSNGKIHPLDLKNSVSENLEKIIAPIRKKFNYLK